jgi:predicted PurR-regulated permease PerM
MLSVIPPLLLALLDSPSKAGAVLLLYFLIQQIEGNLVTPIMEKQVSLLPAYTLALLRVFGFLLVFLGVFLALPILIVIQIWVKEVLIKDILDGWQTAPSRKPVDNP